MAKKKVEKCECGNDCNCGSDCGWGHHKKMGKGPGVYCLGVIGAAVYYIGTAGTFWIGVLGLLKALVWPAFLVYGLLQYIGM